MSNKAQSHHRRSIAIAAVAATVATLPLWQAAANPEGFAVGQGSVADPVTSGSTMTIQQLSDRALINWSRFNIGANETVTFEQPSRSSLVWNQIHDADVSTIMGTLNANGYVVLQNASGIHIGGEATINAHGVLLTTIPMAPPNLLGSGAWQFNTPPPSADIVNEGKIQLDNGGSAFIIARNIRNEGTISAPNGNIGLYAGQKVLVSFRPDGRGLTAQATLPAGSVDNTGKLIADAGKISIQAEVVNQGGLIQANSVRNVNGVIELVASDSLNLGANSDIQAHGDNTVNDGSQSPGGFVVLKGGNTFADDSASRISVAAGTGSAGGADGYAEIFGSNLADASSVQSRINNLSASDFLLGNHLLLNPYEVFVTYDPSDASSSFVNFNVSDLTSFSQIDLHSLDNIYFFALLSLSDKGPRSELSLTANNSISIDANSGIDAGPHWNVNLQAGPAELDFKPDPDLGRSYGIYLDGNGYIQSQDGDINLFAANEVLINDNAGTSGINGIRTINRGNIHVKTLVGDVNTGSSTEGFQFKATAPFYAVSSAVGGISTMAGGDVNIDAGGNVKSYLPIGTSANDAGTGAFGNDPGNVTIRAGGNVYGHYVVANGVGTINASQDIGGFEANENVALSLIKGSWTLNAGGNIYLQEARNPNGVFNATSGGFGGSANAGKHLFDYDSFASLTLNAGNGVYLTGLSIPRVSSSDGVPVILPPSLDITAGAGGVTLSRTMILFPSANGNLHITTTDGGSLVAEQLAGNETTQLIMSDSDQTRWLGSTTFGESDHGSHLIELDNPDPVKFDIAGNIENFVLYVTKHAEITVHGDMTGSSFSGQNLHEDDKTFINVTGQIFNRSPYSFIYLDQGIPNIPLNDLPPNGRATWETIFSLALDPAIISTLTVPKGLLPGLWADYVFQNALLLPGGNPGFVYNPATRRLGFNGDMNIKVATAIISALGKPLTVLRFDDFGIPVLDSSGHFVTETVNWAAADAITTLAMASEGAPAPNDSTQFGYRIGGPGTFSVHAGSISLGNSYGILSCGVGNPPGGNADFKKLASVTSKAADLTVEVDNNLDMLSSTIASLGDGKVDVTVGGTVNLGSPELSGSRGGTADIAYGIYSTGKGGVTVTADGDIDINGSRIAAYNGGNITVLSKHGHVDAGSGGAVQAGIYYYYIDPKTGLAQEKLGGVYGSGILATTLPPDSSMPLPPNSATRPGNITVTTPEGDILASQGGILQEALNGNVGPGPQISLSAGTAASEGSPGFAGNINLGDSGVIGGTVDLKANGNITGLIISRQNSTVNAAQSFSGTVLSGGTANLSAGGTVSGTVIGVGGVNASGAGGVSATLLGQNVAVNGGAAQSTLGTTASATAASQSAAQQSSSDSKRELAKTDDDDKKKKAAKGPSVIRKGRVTVILPKA